MDATLILKNRRGIAIVYIAFMLVALVALAGLVVDIGYMYVNKAKLQNASDAGSLAGAGRLNTQLSLSTYTGSRNAAMYFAKANFNLNLNTNSNNNPEGDIVLGAWNPDTKNFSAATFATISSINAVKVITRKSGDPEDINKGIAANSKFDLFFGKIIGQDKMGVAASSISWRPPRARTFFMIGRGVCNSTVFPVILSPAPGNQNLAWTSLLQPSTNANDVQDNFFCPAEKLPFEEVCGQSIYTSGGVISSVFKSVEVDFYDLNYDAGMKTFAGTGNNRHVTSWKVIVPVSAENDPTVSPYPHPVWGYAEIVISRACGSGGGNACSGRNFSAPGGTCSGGENDVVITQIECRPCADKRFLMGAKPVLAQ